MEFSSVTEAAEEMAKGNIVILMDDEDRENEGDLVCAAEKITPEAINFMAKHGRGLICLALTPEKVDALGLPLMTARNRARFSTAFTVSIEARHGVTTGISAADRATTIRAAANPNAQPEDLVQPGHVFPLRAREGGVLVRAGQTEGSIDLAKIAGLSPSAVICEVMNDDGTMARLPDLEKFAEEHGLKIVTVKEIINYRLKKESLVKKLAEATLPTDHGTFRIAGFENTITGDHHVALIRGEIKPENDTIVRVHSQCLTGDVFHSHRCDCGEQLDTAMKIIAKEGNGVLLYLFQEGRGIGLMNKIMAYALQEEGHDTVEANEKLGFQPDLRDYGIGAQILKEIGVGRMRLLTNNPKKIVGLEGYGLKVVERLPLQIIPKSDNIRYLSTKQTKMGHMLEIKTEGEAK
ncbi:MAG: bifunctional 3,4-dihydroxy-2-butanone-4-phosphate synthase/GTP cyclohydrolase II [Nitrospinae bacterium]|nr:bifunctional 3,4-dihydroxy-2-butanone-4-phosphate synthase/GTP cyclohydrolase II [Nitrospinota bacterium]